ncbi:hypothetical protein FRC01_005524, partial [Tulasnella sp. 417]
MLGRIPETVLSALFDEEENRQLVKYEVLRLKFGLEKVKLGSKPPCQALEPGSDLLRDISPLPEWLQVMIDAPSPHYLGSTNGTPETRPLLIILISPENTNPSEAIPYAIMKVAFALSALAFAQGVLSIAIYGQCGGINGITGTCDSGLVCVVINAYYFQCLTPSSGQTTTGGSAATTTKATTTTKTTTTTGGSVPTGLTTKLPASSGYSALPTASVISGTFDGGMKRYDRAGSSGACQEQTETGEADAVFILQPGATIQNVIIGADQAEGIHCRGPCTVKNVWWADVCEDAITLKQTGSGDVSYIIGGGAFHASDKVVQHNGAGTVSIKNFYVNDFG